MRFNGSVSGGVSGMMEILGEGDTISITPALTSGVEVATFKINEGTSEEETIKLYAPEGFSGSWNDLTDKPTLFSGSYNDLSNKPTFNGTVFSGNVYGLDISDTPHIVGKWFDGKPIYCKHINMGSQIAIGSNQWYYYPDYDASHIHDLVNTTCLVRPGGDLQYPAKDVKCFDVGIDNAQLTFLTLRNGTDYISDVVIYYTDNQDYT